MVANQDFIEAYKELAALIKTNLTNIKHVDLYYDQINSQDQEYPFPEECVFIEFNAEQFKDLGLKVQDMETAVSFYYTFDTLSDSFDQSDNQVYALKFGEGIRKLNKLLHGRVGNHFSGMSRIGLNRFPSVRGTITYVMTYRCIIRDYSAFDETNNVQLAGITLNNNTPPPQPNTLNGMFSIDL